MYLGSKAGWICQQNIGNLDYDDDTSTILSGSVAYETIQSNAEVLNSLELKTLFQKSIKGIDGTIVEHDMRR